MQSRMHDGDVVSESLDDMDDDDLEQAILDRISQRSTSTKPCTDNYPDINEFEQLQTIGRRSQINRQIVLWGVAEGAR